MTDSTEQFEDSIEKFQEGFTYIFEVIYPENRIVVDYNGYDDLVLLTIVNNNTGDEFLDESLGFDVVASFPGDASLEEIKKLNTENEEGWVACYPDDNYYRVKIKFDDYVEMHRIVTGLSELSIWRLLSEGKNINEIVDKVPDELFKWAQQVVTKINKEFNAIENRAKENYEEACKAVRARSMMLRMEPTRKQYAEEFKLYPNTNILFSMLDEREYKSIIWKLIRPDGSIKPEDTDLPKWSN